MARICPILNEKVVYLSCQECEEDCRYAPDKRIPEHMFTLDRRKERRKPQPGKSLVIRHSGGAR